jgi:hypothetical protein
MGCPKDTPKVCFTDSSAAADLCDERITAEALLLHRPLSALHRIAAYCSRLIPSAERYLNSSFTSPDAGEDTVHRTSLPDSVGSTSESIKPSDVYDFTKRTEKVKWPKGKTTLFGRFYLISINRSSQFFW